MKRLLIPVLLMAVVTASHSGTVGDALTEQAEQSIQEIKTRLDLTDQQVEQMTPIIERSIESRRKILSSYGIDVESGQRPEERLGFRGARAMRQELSAVSADTRGELKGILTEDQLAELETMQDEKRTTLRDRLREDR